MKYIITIGNFDGLHIGHQKIIKQSVSMAEKVGARSKLITFKSHTRDLENLILSHEDKLARIYSLGVDEIVELEFNDIRFKSAKEFMAEYLLGAAGLVVGQDFRFAKDRIGNVDDLRSFGRENGLDVVIMDDLFDQGKKISSRDIRDMILAGQMDRASHLLGYEFYVRSVITSGFKRGASLGFRTANIDWPPNIIRPKDGVYYTYIEIDGEGYDAMTMAGIAKTFNQEFSCESYIFNFDRDIYGKEVKLIFRQFLRENKKFESREDLISQLKRDKIKSIELAADYHYSFTNY